MNSDERELLFFYASRDAEFYDCMAPLTQPHLDLIYDTAVELVMYSLGDRVTDRPRVLVAGSGTGAEVLRILDRLPHAEVVAVDFSPAMNDQLLSKLQARSAERRVTIVASDFLSAGLFTEIADKTQDSARGRFDAAVAGFFLHHYELEAKRAFFKIMHDVLKPGGALVHADLFDFTSAALSQFAHNFGERWMVRQMTTPDDALLPNYRALGSHAERLRTQWVEHWNTTHRYTPIEASTGAADRPGQAQLAMESGFSDVGCPFRLWEVGIMWARKRSEDRA